MKNECGYWDGRRCTWDDRKCPPAYPDCRIYQIVTRKPTKPYRPMQDYLTERENRRLQ